MPLVRDLLDLPDRVNKSDYVQGLNAGVADPELTVSRYAITPALVGAFGSALGMVKSALGGVRGMPIYVDGSFGSGKSHFMALLNLMLAGHDAPWRKPELHALRAEHDWIGKRRLLQVPVHMLGTGSFESKVFGAALDLLRRDHPTADLPLLFADAPVFDNAEQLRQQVGDARFFAELNRGLAAAAPSFLGAVAATAATTWDLTRYDACRTSADPAERSKLLTRLTATWLPAYADVTDRWVSADKGWNELARHAATLGYHGVVLYLDEMILWLMGMISDPDRVSAELEKLVQLLEAKDASRRPLPILAFIARQRKPKDIVLGADDLAGDERASVFEKMSQHEGRFGSLDLPDTTLRAIIPKRVVIPRDAAAAEALRLAFDRNWRTGAAARGDLAAGTAAEADFRSVYPFSPALVDALIALSDQLQRERTAIRILVEFLVEHADGLTLEQWVPVGDVFDLIAGGEDAFDPAAQSAFQRARNLYLEQILPFLQAHHKVQHTCQRNQPGHPIRIGCSGCPIVTCRTDNRLVKTALLAALAPRARPLQDLTVTKLLHLNHGAFGGAPEDIKLDLATHRLRQLAAAVSQVRVEGDGDPTVRISLQSVDIGPILERAAPFDTRQRRKSLLRRLLWEELGVSDEASLVQVPHVYRHVDRPGAVRFGNVRTLPDQDFRCPPGADWQVVIDYPFDDPGFTPYDDEQHLHRLCGTLRDTHTLVWLPTFFSERTELDLGELCKLDHLLSGNHLAAALTHVPPDEHKQALTDLQAYRARIEADLRTALAAAYGLRDDDASKHLIDVSRAPTTHLLALDDGLEPRNPRHLHTSTAIRDLAQQVLEHRFPNHPVFQDKLTPAKARRLTELLTTLFEADAPEAVPKDEEALLTDLAGPLGLCRVFNHKAERLTRATDALETQRLQLAEPDPSVGQLRAWADPDHTRGLPDLAADLIGWAWSLAHKRLLTLHGKPIPWPDNGRLPADARYESPDLPSPAEFQAAITVANALGVSPPGRTANAKNVTAFATLVRTVAESSEGRALAATPASLADRLRTFGDGQPAPRLRTAEAASALIAAARTTGAAHLVRALATLDLSESSPTAIDRARRDAAEVTATLTGPLWQTLELLRTADLDADKQARAADVLARVSRALAQDQLHVSLAPEVRRASDDALNLLKRRADPTWQTAWTTGGTVPAAAALAQLDAARAELAQRLSTTDGELRVTLALRLEARRESE